jgi:glucose/arabinose dehydrogenase
LFNGIVVSNKWIYVTSGSRTDHGEVESQNGTFADLREIALTSRMYRFAIDSKDIVLKNDETAVEPYVYARGFRNAYDPAFAPNGELFVGDNGPDADLPDELNWVRQGGHFGFPWRFGDIDNPQRDPAYDPAKDLRLQQDFTAVQIGAYRNDPTYPAAPSKFLDPIINQGPAATNYRGADGKSYDAAQQGKTLAGLTPHRSPLGLVFADQTFPKSWQGDGQTLNGFLLSWGAAGGTLPDRGQDMLALQLSKSGDNYTMTARQIVRDLRNPIDSAIVGDKIYVLEFGDKVAIWEFTFHE